MKSRRQEKILQLIEENVILTQDELQDCLLQLGFNVTQSTVSRDIKELRIIKAQDINGVHRYISARNAKVGTTEKSKEHYIDVFLKSAIDVKYAMNNVVIKCYNGMASGACVAVDALYGDTILGSLAGDDTILLVTKNEHDSAAITDRIQKIIK